MRTHLERVSGSKIALSVSFRRRWCLPCMGMKFPQVSADRCRRSGVHHGHVPVYPQPVDEPRGRMVSCHITARSHSVHANLQAKVNPHR